MVFQPHAMSAEIEHLANEVRTAFDDDAAIQIERKSNIAPAIGRIASGKTSPAVLHFDAITVYIVQCHMPG